MPEKTLAEFAATFDRALLQPRLAEAEQQRRMIIESFPLETFGDLALERYALRDQNRTTLCYMLEFGSSALGSIKGGSADKLGIYFHKSGQWKCAIPGLTDVANAWSGLRSDLTDAVKLVETSQWDLIDSLPLARYVPALRTKWLHVHFPKQVISIYALNHIVYYIEQLGGTFSRREGKYTASANQQLVTILRGIPELESRSLWEISQLLYSWNPPPSKTAKSASEDADADAVCRYVKIAPGKDALLWQDCLDGGCIYIGWDELGDLYQYGSLELLVGRFDELKPPTDGSIRKMNREKAAEVWTLRELRAGDKIVANKGMSQVLGVGTVTETGYAFDDRREHHKHTVSVIWDTHYARTIPKQQFWAWQTVADLTEEQKNLIFGNSTSLREMTSLTPPPALNQILYGPPGTGKTHCAIREAAAIIVRQPGLNDQDAKAAYDRASAEGQVRLVTFHQSFSYEDFIEGIRPVLEEGGEARFTIRDGVFKEIATEALFACLEKTPVLIGTPAEIKLPSSAAMPRRPGPDTKTGRVWAIADELSSPEEPATRMAVFEKASAEGINNNTVHTQYGHWAKAKGLTKPRLVSTTTSSQQGADEDGEAFVDSIIQAYLKLGSASGWQLRADRKYPPYVLIIDEINRGNISRIFGELITLIEDDKRDGAANALRVALPSSREFFTVPPNLFLLGTMNTADKSLALLDVALRRRFEFRELAPDFSVCGLPGDMQFVLKRLNERIELRKDRDHRVGHAFFMGVKDVPSFNRAFARKVVPLLQEYFFNDIDGARFVLGEIGREGEPGFLRQITAVASDAKYQRNRWRWFTDVEPGMDCWVRLRDTLGGGIP